MSDLLKRSVKQKEKQVGPENLTFCIH